MSDTDFWKRVERHFLRWIGPVVFWWIVAVIAATAYLSITGCGK